MMSSKLGKSEYPIYKFEVGIDQTTYILHINNTLVLKLFMVYILTIMLFGLTKQYSEYFTTSKKIFFVISCYTSLNYLRFEVYIVL